MKNIILIISLLFTYSCELGALYWFLSSGGPDGGEAPWEEAGGYEKEAWEEPATEEHEHKYYHPE